MKAGICCQPLGATFQAAHKAAPDYLEVSNSAAFRWTDAEYEEVVHNVKSGIPVAAANGMLMGDFRLTGENITPWEEIRAFLEKSFARIASLGARKVVFGSGTARRVPDGFSASLAYEQLSDLLRRVARVARKNDLCVVIEPLNHLETNVLTTVRETASFIRELNEPDVRLLADSYHMAVEAEPFESLCAYTDLLEHAHLAEAKFASSEFRRTPSREDTLGISAFVRVLKSCGYNGGVSLECSSRTGDWGLDMIEAVAALREWFGQKEYE